jgi:hypothetical protein
MSRKSEDEQEFSDEETVTWEQARGFVLKFGKFKGLSLEEMIKTKDRRWLLRFYLGWDKLRDDARESIRAA